MVRRVITMMAGFALAAPAMAQGDPPGATVRDDPIAVERAWVGTGRAPDPSCDNPDPLAPEGEGTIVVCRRHDSDRWRVPSTAESDPKSAQALHTGARVPPNVGSIPDCATPGVHCMRMGHAPPPIYYFDITKLPPPSPGSDADLIAKGEAPAP